MRASKTLFILLSSAALVFAFGGCGKKKKKKKAAPPEVTHKPKDKGPNSCDLRATKNLCMEYLGAHGKASDVESNCAGWENAVFIKGTCPGEKARGVCTSVNGPNTTRMIIYEGAELAEQEESCLLGGGKWAKIVAAPPTQ